MRSTHFSKAITFLPLLLLAPVLLAQSSDATSSNPAMSKVRIVRLSEVRGSVQIDRSDGRGYERGIANLPIVEQNQLRTGEGIAEVEFEDNSSLRLAPNSEVEFPRLERASSGATVSSVHLVQGTAYLSLVKPQSGKVANEFTLMFGDRTLKLDPATHIRLSLEGTEAKLAVLDGAVRLDEANGALSVPKKKTAVFQLTGESEPTIAHNVEASPFDTWDHQAASYHSNVAALGMFNSPYSYGLRDLSYYGSFMNSPGCGSMWRPYFASAAWDPFANGTWAWYQGAGYSWVSPYPWGWTPYHSGSWAFCNNVGWGWYPGDGGAWYGVNNIAALNSIQRTSAGNGHTLPPHLPAHPPLPHAPSMIAVNTKPIPASQIAFATSSFVFRKDSAGFGVPRGALGNLNKFSRESISRGSASTAIYASVPRSAQSFAGGSRSELSASIHRGYAPSFNPSSAGNSYNSSSYAGSGSTSGMSPGASAPAPAPVAPAAPSMPSGGGGVRR